MQNETATLEIVFNKSFIRILIRSFHKYETSVFFNFKKREKKPYTLYEGK